MSNSLHSVIAPYVGQDVTPTPFTAPGTAGVPPVHVTVGLKGGTKTFTTSASAQSSSKLGKTKSEASPASGGAAANGLAQAAAQASGSK